MSELDTVAAELAPTGTLRVVINLGNPVLAQGDEADPSGVSVDLARAVATALALPVEFRCVRAARQSFEALRDGEVDLAFLAVEPARAADVAFTAPYVIIEGVFAVPTDSPIRTVDEVDRDGVRIGVKEGSAYDLFLTRTLQHASVVRGVEGTEAFREQGLDVAAGIRQPITSFVHEHPGHRLIEPRFMEIQQAMATRRDRSASALRFLADLVEDLKANGFVADALTRSNQQATVAPPA